MKHLKLFLLFWKNFIFGDNPSIALFVLWSIACLYAFSQFNFNLWWFLPAVSVLVIFSVALVPPKGNLKLSYLQHAAILFLASCAVVLLPLALFRWQSHSVVVELSASLNYYILCCLVIGLIGGLVAKRFLLIGHCLALLAAVLLIVY